MSMIFSTTEGSESCHPLVPFPKKTRHHPRPLTTTTATPKKGLDQELTVVISPS
jgi:hypothetical protein